MSTGHETGAMTPDGAGTDVVLFWEAPLMASDFTLEFERPLIELEKRISG